MGSGAGTRFGRGSLARGQVAFLSEGQALHRSLLPEVCPLPDPWLGGGGWTGGEFAQARLDLTGW